LNRPNLIVTRASLLRRRLLTTSLVVGIIAFGFFMYEFGLSSAGYSHIETFQEQNRMASENQKLVDQNKRLSERVAILEMADKIDRGAYGKVETELVELQARILEQQEDIEFYKGIVNEDDGTGLRIQDFQISRGFGAHEYDLRVVLAQAFRSDRKVSGRVELVIEGVQRGKATRLSLQEVGAEGTTAPLRYSFRYFQDLKAAVVLPEDFSPEKVLVIVKGSGKSSKTVEEFFIWDMKAG
jgi:hypothetical protein